MVNAILNSSQGLIDIAISTVEDLYEDSGGLPNSLVFPRIEDIEAELDKTTVQDLRQAMTVQIISPSVEASPEYAVPAMKKTFGLCGVVHEIDKVRLFVFVYTYFLADKPNVFIFPNSGKSWSLLMFTYVTKVLSYGTGTPFTL